MDVRMEIFNGDLAIIVNKRHIKTSYDTNVLSNYIDAMCHLHCFSMGLNDEDIRKLINENKGIYIGFIAVGEKFYTFDYIEKNNSILLRE